MDLFLIFSILILHLIIMPIIIYKQINYWFYGNKTKFFLLIPVPFLFLFFTFHLVFIWGILLCYPLYLFYLYFNKKFQSKNIFILYNSVLIGACLLLHSIIFELLGLPVLNLFFTFYYDLFIFSFLYVYVLLNLLFIKSLIKFNIIIKILFIVVNIFIYMFFVHYFSGDPHMMSEKEYKEIINKNIKQKVYNGIEDYQKELEFIEKLIQENNISDEDKFFLILKIENFLKPKILENGGEVTPINPEHQKFFDEYLDKWRRKDKK